MQHQVYHGLDVTKLFCAFLIVYMHAFFPDLGAVSEWFRYVITTTGVPFFFITSGFFFKKGLLKNNNSKDYLRRYSLRVGKMYLAWTIITLPISWLCIEWGHPDYSTPLKIAYLFRMFFFSGSCGIYWYLLALFVCCFIIYYFSVKKRLSLLYLIATILFIIGVIYDSPYNNDNICFQFIHIVFGSERNFFNVGLFYMCVGTFFASNNIRCPNLICIIIFILSVTARTMEVRYLGINCMQAVIAAALFLCAQNININISDKCSIALRKLSTAIYLLHFPFLLVVDYNFKRGTMTGYFSALAFCFIAYYLLNRLLSKKQKALLFG